MPAIDNKSLSVCPATSPSPLGAGKTTTLTLPLLPSSLKGTEWFEPHLHSQLPHPCTTGIMLSIATVVALSIAVLIWAAFSSPTATTALNLVNSPASVCFCTIPTPTTLLFRLGRSVFTISASLIFQPFSNISCRDVILPVATRLPSFVLGTHGACSSAPLSATAMTTSPPPQLSWL